MRERWWLTAFAIVLVVIWSHGERGKAAEEARAQMAEAKADSAYLDVLESERRRRQDSVRYEIQAKRLELSRDSAVARADRAARARPQVVERIIRVAGDSAAVVEAVAELEAVHEQEVGSLRSALAYADSLLVAERDD